METTLQRKARVVKRRLRACPSRRIFFPRDALSKIEPTRRVAVANQLLASLLSSVKLLQCIWNRTHYRICSTLRTFMRSRPSSKQLLTPVSTPEDDLRHHLLALQLEPIEETKPLDLVENNPEDTSDWGWFEDFASRDAEEVERFQSFHQDDLHRAA
ncbi:hypothetical protein AC1031_002289 [Aphanomyces cochlioides]|nr:hypothetical protein AC1031_002289 [Aphanomyces cochlioides]